VGFHLPAIPLLLQQMTMRMHHHEFLLRRLQHPMILVLPMRVLRRQWLEREDQYQPDSVEA